MNELDFRKQFPRNTYLSFYDLNFDFLTNYNIISLKITDYMVI